MMGSTAARESAATAAAPPSARDVLVMHTAVAMASVRASLARAIGWPESRMTAHTSSAPRTALARVASMAAPHTLGSITASAASSAWKIVAARAPPSQNSVTLKATLTGDWPRLTTSTTIGPSRMPSSIAHGWAKMRPKTSGSSLSEKMWTLRRNSTCTTHSSATAKAPASSHHAGRGCGPRACRWRTCRRVSARALAPIAAIRPQTRGWPPGRRRRPRPRGAGVLRGLEPGAGTAQPSPQQEPPHEEPPHEEPPHEEPPQDEPPQDEPPQDEPPHEEPPHEEPPHLPAPQLEPSGPTGPTSALWPFDSPTTSLATRPRIAAGWNVWTAVAGSGLAAPTARMTLSRPAPWASGPGPDSGSAEDLTIALTWSGVRSGRRSSSSATAPETTAAACDVPLPLNRSSPARASGCARSRAEFGSRRLAIERPGATRSGLRPRPRLDHDGTTSSATAAVPDRSSAAIERMKGS